MQIFLDNETDYNPGFDLEELTKEVSKYILSEEKCPFQCEISLLVTDDEGIREVNRDFRGIDKETDVLSFPAFDYEKAGDFGFYQSEEFYGNINPDNGCFVLGDIMINKTRLNAQAAECGHSEKREFAFLVAHSVLHLIGYDHMTDEEAAVMEGKQKEYLDALGISRDSKEQ